ncbi:MAG TPA: glycosyltransferase family A protein [Burkholderiaceae bacterium]|nr:glycosyltransferase family A protein [Burkholderiaceae bacterium]
MSIVLPVGYGDKYFSIALACALSQTHSPIEIILLDNSPAPIRHLVPMDVRIRYVRCERSTIGALRNKGNGLARGNVLAHWDEDDWYSNDRVAVQLERLRRSGRAVTGWHTLLYHNTADGTCHRYRYAAMPPYAVGTSLTYLRSWWLAHPLPEIAKGEDYYFQLESAQAGQLDSTDSGQLGVARAHRDSTCPPLFGSGQFPVIPHTALPDAFWQAMHP